MNEIRYDAKQRAHSSMPCNAYVNNSAQNYSKNKRFNKSAAGTKEVCARRQRGKRKYVGASANGEQHSATTRALVLRRHRPAAAFVAAFPHCLSLPFRALMNIDPAFLTRPRCRAATALRALAPS